MRGRMEECDWLWCLLQGESRKRRKKKKSNDVIIHADGGAGVRYQTWIRHAAEQDLPLIL